MTAPDFANALRALATLACALGAFGAVRVAWFYTHARLVSPSRALHVATATSGWVLAEVLMAWAEVGRWGQPLEALPTPLVLLSNVLVFHGVHALHARARLLERGGVRNE